MVESCARVDEVQLLISHGADVTATQRFGAMILNDYDEDEEVERDGGCIMDTWPRTLLHQLMFYTVKRFNTYDSDTKLATTSHSESQRDYFATRCAALARSLPTGTHSHTTCRR